MAAALPSTVLSKQLLHGRSPGGSVLLSARVRTPAPPSISTMTSSSPSKGVSLRSERGPWRALCTGNTYGSSPASPSDLVHAFYSSVNEKDMRRLRELLSDDCFLEDLAFYTAFRGRKEVMQFLERLTEAMGKNVKFVPGSICQGNERTASAAWHLEWKGKRVPFTRGCSFYEFCPDGDRLLLGRALVIVESPLKPGKLAVELLKIIISTFDTFPKLATKFLERPYAVVQFLISIYRTFVEPLIFPFLLYYTHLWGCVVRAIKSVVSFIVWLLKMFM